MTPSLDAVLGVSCGGEPIGLVTLSNADLRIGLSNYGARMLSIQAPDRDGRFDHVLLGFDDPATILKAGSFGAVLGRYANRIAGGQFDLDGETFTLPRNDGDTTLHGGPGGFGKRFWSLADRTDKSATFALESLDGDQGFPGALSVRATYALDGPALRLTLDATTTRATPVNLSAHPYFNLAGQDALDVCDHALHVAATHYLPTDANQIPTGELRSVDGTAFDFRTPVIIGGRIRNPDPQLRYARGYDHCFVLDGAAGSLRTAARLSHAGSGRTLDIETDLAGLQVYTSNSLDGSLVGHGGCYRQTSGLALEAQAFPDAPNQPTFPSTILRPGNRFEATIVYRFSVA
jgi:aldose 1-epimerase